MIEKDANPLDYKEQKINRLVRYIRHSNDLRDENKKLKEECILREILDTLQTNRLKIAEEKLRKILGR